MPDESAPIICPTTRWYSRRRLLMIGMLLFFSAFFFYDWKVRYPRDREVYHEYWPRYQEMVKAGKEDAWFEEAKAKKWPAKPVEKDWERKIGEQLFFAVLTGIGGLVMLGLFLRNRKRTLTADETSFTTPDGRTIPFADVFRIDRRKWDNKGLAYVSYRDDGSERKAVIDDLIFAGAVRVLDRVQASFKGEIIDLERPAPPASDQPAADETEDSLPQSPTPAPGAGTDPR